MVKYVEAYARMKIQEVQIHQIPWEENERVDELAQLASSLTECASQDPLYLESTTSLAIQDVKEPAKEWEEIIPDWRAELEAYLRDRTAQLTARSLFS